MKVYYFIIPLVFLGGLSSCSNYIKKFSKRREPKVADQSALNLRRDSINPDHYRYGNSYIKKNGLGQWELYTQGNGFERGVATAALEQHLLQDQEKLFVDFIKTYVPSEKKLKRLRVVVGFFNRKLHKRVLPEHKQEIYGLSKLLPKDFEYIAPNYIRALNYHAAHDIGHALQNMNLVACTGFGVWGKDKTNNELILGRNLDFYVGDAFAEEKVLSFVKPDTGHAFMFVTWPGMIGACSGMNEHGLTVSLNSAKSKIPLKVATPVALLAREILQYATTIDEAVQIASKRKVYVAEMFMIGSAKDSSAAIIDMSPKGMGVYRPEGERLICTNHFQSDRFAKTRRTRKNKEVSSSVYRYERVTELINATAKFDQHSAADLLRNIKGRKDEDIGLGNENAVNQLIAHHSIIFKPYQRQVWVSSNPFSLGAFACYDLDDVFATKNTKPVDSLVIAASPMLDNEYKKYETYKWMKDSISTCIDKKQCSKLTESFLTRFKLSNDKYFKTWEVLGQCYFEQGKFEQACKHYETGLKLSVPREVDRDAMEKLYKKAKRKCKNR